MNADADPPFSPVPPPAGYRDPRPEALAPHEREDAWHDESVELRLSPRAWCGVAVVVVVAVIGLPRLAYQWESFEPGRDYRQPQALTEDYWQYGRWTANAARQSQVLVLGDSVVWGEYAKPSETLTAAFNQSNVTPRLANGGLKGLHPLALEGLVDGWIPRAGLAGIVLHFNPIWMTSPERDLQARETLGFNHPRLVPQWQWRLAAYQASWDERLGITFTRGVPLFQWSRHLQLTAWDRLDAPRWTLEHPRENPLAAIRTTAPLPLDEPASRVSPRAPTPKPQAYEWVAPAQSLQFQAFVRTLDRVQQRDLPLACWIGRLNPATQTSESVAQEQVIIDTLIEELNRRTISWVELPVDAAWMADASHPLPRGYGEQAKFLEASPKFQRWLQQQANPETPGSAAED